MRRAVMLIVIGCVMLLSSATLVVSNESVAYRAAEESEEMLRGIEKAMLDDMPGTADASEGLMPVREVNGTNIIGVISVPSVGIEVPVAESWSYENLRKSACRYSGTAEDGGLIILAHNYKRHFGNLKNAKKGDEVQFLDINGNLCTYTITGIEILGKYDLERLTEADCDMTLFTCTYGGRNRVTVRCAKK